MRALLLLLTIALGACNSIPRAPKLPTEVGYLPQRTSRKLVEHWSASGYPAEVSGRPIRLLDRHSAVSQIATVTPARSISQDDNDKKHLGTVAMLHDGSSPSKIAITDTAWQLSSQPGTLVARSEPDGSLTLTAFDFRDQQQHAGYPLAHHHGISFDYAEEQADSPFASFFSLIRPRKWTNQRGFYLATEYDPEKIPLVFIHGLLSTPLDFKELASHIGSEADLWDRYQFWYYFYPSGDPWVLTAAHFREDFRTLANTLDPQKKHRPLRSQTTLLAHSMGGLISRLSISEQSEKLYQQYLNQPIDQLPLLPEEMAKLRQQLLFKPLTEPATVILLATPNHGSELARGPLYWLAQTLIRKPARLLKTSPLGKDKKEDDFPLARTNALTSHGRALYQGRTFSVTGLRSDSVALKALNSMEVRKGVRIHNIIATLTGREFGWGDWVVPYKSARLSRADSETLVRDNHWLIRRKKSSQIVIDLLRQELSPS